VSDPTPEQVEQIRRLAAAAGGVNGLLRWARMVVPKCPGGRPRGSSRLAEIDAVLLEAARAAAVRSDVPLASVLRWNVMLCGGANLGTSQTAAVKRLQDKARRLG